MKRFVIQALCVVVASLGAAGAALAQENAGCPSITGEWAYSKTGTLLPPTGPVPYAAVGKLEFRVDGTVSGSQVTNTAGIVQKSVMRGTGLLEADCTVSATVSVYDETDTVLLRTADMTLVIDDNGREARGMVTKLTLANGVAVPQVITLTARKVFNNRGQGQ